MHEVTIRTSVLGIRIKEKRLQNGELYILDPHMARSSEFDQSKHWTIGPKLAVERNEWDDIVVSRLDTSVTPPDIHKKVYSATVLSQEPIKTGLFIKREISVR